jgi:hypothetical protein
VSGESVMRAVEEGCAIMLSSAFTIH